MKMLKEMELSSTPVRFIPSRMKRTQVAGPKCESVGLRQKGSLVAELGAVTCNYVSCKFYDFVLHESGIYPAT